MIDIIALIISTVCTIAVITIVDIARNRNKYDDA